jgi:ribonucleotide reductase alpha subunit
MYNRVLEFFNGDEMAASVFMKKYSYNNTETPQDVCKRLTREFARIEKKYEAKPENFENLSEYGKQRYGDVKDLENHLYHFLEDFKYIVSGGSGLEGIGTDKNGSYSNCYKDSDPQDDSNSIIEVGKEIFNISKRRGGTSVDVSYLRPEGATVHNASRESSGIVSWMRIYNAISSEVGQNGRMSGTMITLHVEHPDVLAFIKAKRDKTQLTRTNISLKFSKDFFDAVVDNKDFLLRFPVDLNIKDIDHSEFEYDKLIEVGDNQYVKKVKAKDIWNEFLISNHSCGDPGCLFWDYSLEHDGSSVYPEFKPAGVNLCVHPNTSLLTKNGFYDIIELVGQDVEIWNGNKWTMVNPFKTGENIDMYKVEFSDGSDLICTDYHEFTIIDGENNSIRKPLIELSEEVELDKFFYPIIEFPKIDKDGLILYREGFEAGTYYKHTATTSIDYKTKLNNVPIISDASQRVSWLSGLMKSSNITTDKAICIKSLNKNFLYNVKSMLMTLGIKSGIMTFNDKIFYLHLLISDWKKLLTIITMPLNVNEYDTDETKNKDDDHNTFTSDIKIKSIDYIGRSDAYCVTDNIDHTALFNHVMTGQCGELPLAELQSCILVAANLYNLVKNPFKYNSEIDFEKAYQVFYETICIGDDYIDLELEQLYKILKKIEPDIDSTIITHKEYKYFCVDNDKDINSEFLTWLTVRDKLIKGRKLGCGFLGLGDMYAALGLPYGEPETTEKLMKVKLRAELDATIDLSIVRGSFLSYDTNKEYIGEFKRPANEWYNHLMTNFQPQVMKMIAYGRRNVTWSCIAPTGTLGIITQLTSGIEPLFAPFYKRRVKVFKENEPYDVIDVDGQKFKENYVVHHKLMEWLKNGNFTYEKLIENCKEEDWKRIYEMSPYYNQCANDLPIDVRTKTQSLINKYICSSISSTVNLPNNVTVEDMANVYNSAYRNGCKGITCYRDGSKGGVLITDKNDDECKEFYERHIPKLPKELKGDFYKIKYKGETYIIIVGIHPKCDFPVEMFCFKPTLDNIDVKVPFKNITDHTGRRIKVKSGVYSFESEFIKIPNLGEHNSIPEKQLSINISLMLRHGTPKQYIVDTIKRFDGDISSFSSVAARILMKYVKKNELKEEICPECGLKLINENGCKHCSCGYSACN